MNDRQWLKDYVDNINKDLNAAIALKDFQDLKNSHLPKSLFRYRSLSDDVKIIDNKEITQAELEITNFEKDQIFLSSPEQFNDPYDSKPLFNEIDLFTKILEDDVMQKLLMNDINKLIQENKIDTKITEDNTKIIFEHIVKNMPKHLYKAYNDLKISCFTESFDNMLMWSHYANYHKGYCVEYNIEKLDPKSIFVLGLYPAVYSEKILDLSEHLINFYKNAINNLINGTNRTMASDFLSLLCVLYKSTCWEYEKEWRLVYHKLLHQLPEPCLIKIPKPERIYLGTKIEEHHKNKLIKIAQNKDVEVLQMNISKSEYKLYAEKL